MNDPIEMRATATENMTAAGPAEEEKQGNEQYILRQKWLAYLEQYLTLRHFFPATQQYLTSLAVFLQNEAQLTAPTAGENPPLLLHYLKHYLQNNPSITLTGYLESFKTLYAAKFWAPLSDEEKAQPAAQIATAENMLETAYEMNLGAAIDAPDSNRVSAQSRLETILTACACIEPDSIPFNLLQEIITEPNFLNDIEQLKKYGLLKIVDNRVHIEPALSVLIQKKLGPKKIQKQQAAWIVLLEKKQSGKELFWAASSSGEIGFVKLLLKHNVYLANETHRRLIELNNQLTKLTDRKSLMVKQCIAAIEDQKRLNRELITAVTQGNAALVQKLLNDKAYVDARNESGDTALHVAVLNNHKNIADLLMDNGADISMSGSRMATAAQMAILNSWVESESRLVKQHLENEKLRKAVKNGSLEQVQDLLKEGTVQIEAIFNDRTLLMMAAEDGHLEIVEALLERGADITTIASSYSKTNALSLAAGCGHVDVVGFLLQKGSDQTVTNADGHTALHLAAQNNHADVVKLLLENNAPIHAKNNQGKTAEDLAKSYECLVLLRKARGNLPELSQQEKNDKLIAEIKKGNLLEVQWLLEHEGASAEAKDQYGNTALHLAMLQKHLPVLFRDLHSNLYEKLVGLILSQKPDLEARNSAGNTPLHLAVHCHRVTQALLKKGADITAKDANRRTAAVIARDCGWLDWAEALGKQQENTKALITAAQECDLQKIESPLNEKNAPSIEARDSMGYTPLIWAAHAGHASTVRFLLERGADMTAITKSTGGTALHIATQRGHAEVVEILLAAGADITVRNACGRTAEDLADTKNHQRCLAVLRTARLLADDQRRAPLPPSMAAAMPLTFMAPPVAPAAAGATGGDPVLGNKR